MSKWIKKDDRVVVIAGNDKGKTGTVLRRQGDRLVIQGVNVRKRHMKRRSESIGPRIVSMEMPIHISNVALCDESGLRIKLRVRSHADGGKELIYQRDDQEIVYRQIRK